MRVERKRARERKRGKIERQSSERAQIIESQGD